MRMTATQKRRFTAGVEALRDWIQGVKGETADDVLRLRSALCTARGLIVGQLENDAGLAAIEDWLERTVGADQRHVERIENALNVVAILRGRDGKCAASCGDLLKGPVCPACSCCRACAKAYDYKTPGKKCPGCQINPDKVRPIRVKRPVSKKAGAR